jgi:hypothetical protein
MRIFLYTLLCSITLLCGCSTTSTIVKNREYERYSYEYLGALREIQESGPEIPSTVVIAGEKLPDEVLRFPKANVDSNTVTIKDVEVRRIDESMTELVSNTEPRVTLTVPTNSVKSVSKNGYSSFTKSASQWWKLFLPLGLTIVLALGIGLLVKDDGWALLGLVIGSLYAAAIGTVCMFFWLVTNVGLFSRVVHQKIVNATWRFFP